MTKTVPDNKKPTLRLWASFQATPLRRTVRVHLASISLILATQILLGILQDNSSIILFGLGLIVMWMLIEATPKLRSIIGLPLIALTIATALEINRYPDTPWILLNLSAGLAAWDTYHLLDRSSTIDHIDRPTEFESAHLRPLLLLLVLGSAAGIAVMLVEIDLGFGLVLVLGILTIFGIGQTVRYLRRNNA